MAKKRRKAEPLGAVKALFWLYIVLLVVFVVVKFDGSVETLQNRMETARYIRSVEPDYNLNLIPLRTIRSQLAHIHSGWAVKNLLANAVAFVPFGYLLPRAHRNLRRWWSVLGISLVTICTIEVVQYITYLGACDVDDLLLNLAGCGVGWLGYVLSTRN